MQMQIVLWGLLAISVTALIIGCSEWFKGRGHHLTLAAISNVAMVVSLLLGDGYPVWRYGCLAIVCIFVGYTFITLRHRVRWTSPTMLFSAASILLIVIMTFVPGIPGRLEIVLLYAVVALTALFIGTMFWETGKALLRHRISP